MFVFDNNVAIHADNILSAIFEYGTIKNIAIPVAGTNWQLMINVPYCYKVWHIAIDGHKPVECIEILNTNHTMEKLGITLGIDSGIDSGIDLGIDSGSNDPASIQTAAIAASIKDSIDRGSNRGRVGPAVGGLAVHRTTSYAVHCCGPVPPQYLRH